MTRDEDWVKSDYVDSVDYDDGNDEDEAGTAASSLGRTSRRRGPPRRRLPEVAAVRRRAGVERARPGARNATSAAVAVSRCVEPTHTNTKP